MNQRYFTKRLLCVLALALGLLAGSVVQADRHGQAADGRDGQQAGIKADPRRHGRARFIWLHKHAR